MEDGFNVNYIILGVVKLHLLFKESVTVQKRQKLHLVPVHTAASWVIGSQMVSSKYRCERGPSILKMLWNPVTWTTFEGGWGCKWPQSFSSVYANVSWAILKVPVLNYGLFKILRCCGQSQLMQFEHEFYSCLTVVACSHANEYVLKF